MGLSFNERVNRSGYLEKLTLWDFKPMNKTCDRQPLRLRQHSAAFVDRSGQFNVSPNAKKNFHQTPMPSRPNGQVTRSKTARLATGQVMIVSPNPSAFVSLAVRVGWEVSDFSDADGAQEEAERTCPDLVLVDLRSLQASNQFRRLCESLRGYDDSMLLVVCGHGDAEEEIWARSLGVWVYFPGVTDERLWAALFEDVLHIRRRRLASQQPGIGPMNSHPNQKLTV